MQITSWNGIQEEKLAEGITRRMFWGQNIMVVQIQLAPNVVVPVHEHVSEQVTMIQDGSLTMSFSDGSESVVLKKGDMIVIPGSKAHGVDVGEDGCVAMDVFSPIREDFIKGTAGYFGGGEPPDPYRRLQGYLELQGMKTTLEELKKIPLTLLARFVYEKECITMGELRNILGMDKAQAKALLREWKHGDDHSESSYKRKLDRMIVLPPFAVSPKNEQG